MTDWTNPRTWNVGELVTKAMLDTHLRDNLLHLKEKLDIALKLVGRRGGSATDWHSPGTTNYTPTSVKVQTGVVNFNAIDEPSGSRYYQSISVTFPEAFTYTPMILCSMATVFTDKLMVVTASPSTTGATIYVVSTAIAAGYRVSWMAIGE